MDVLMISLPVFKTSHSVITGIARTIDYSIVLDKGIEVRNYNYVVRNPDKMIIQLGPVKSFFNKDYFKDRDKIVEFNLLFTDPDLKRDFDKMRFNDKTVQTSLVEKHVISDELLLKTPLFYDRDSIIESHNLVELVKLVRAYKDATPMDWQGKLYKCFESIDKLKPLKDFKNSPLFLRMNDDRLLISADTNDLAFVKKNVWIKNFPKQFKASLSAYNNPPLYSLGNTGEISELLRTIWLR